MLRRNPSLVEQVKLNLKQRIINAEFDNGRIPSESSLAGELKVSRNTVRDALSRLEMEGVILRKQGAGTFVNQTTLLVKSRLEEIIPYESLIAEHGYTPSIQLISVNERPADSNTITALNLDAEATVLAAEKLFLAGAEPVIFTQTYVPMAIIRQAYSADDLRKPIYRFLPEHCHQDLAYYFTEIVPLLAPGWLADRLKLQHPQTPLLCFEEIGHNQENQPIIKASSYFRDDLLRLRLIRRQALG